MHLIAPDILDEARGLTPTVSLVAFGIGLLLWATGWRWHRFWTVAGITIAGGLYGLSSGQVVGWYILALAVLLAVAAGVLALELARVVAFAAGGLSAWLIAGAFLPDARELTLFFLAGGIVAVLLYRYWMMAITSFIGTLIAGHAAIVMANTWLGFDGGGWAERNPIGLSIAVGLLAALGLAVQGMQSRWESERASGEPRQSFFRGRFRRTPPATPAVDAFRK